MLQSSERVGWVAGSPTRMHVSNSFLPIIPGSAMENSIASVGYAGGCPPRTLDIGKFHRTRTETNISICSEPDLICHNLRASKSDDRRFWTAQNSSTDFKDIVEL